MGAVLGRVRGIQRGDEKRRGNSRVSQEAQGTEGVSIDDLLDVAGHRCCRSRRNRMKERENREFWIRANDYPSHNAINRYLYIVITGFLRVRQDQDHA